ncbi:MAG: N-acetylmuramoyl-L-alanine amidase [Actinomycetota bacterium]|nr:N-acetylmuramoyl-L-alanine amidase [Actinomycetota bacterium]
MRKWTYPALILLVLGALVFPPTPVASYGRACICIDPGHGGSDPGAVSNGVNEKDVNLDVALRTRALLQQLGFEIVMTRESDVYVSLEERCRVANACGAYVFVSIHTNAHTSTTAEGTETYCYYSSEKGRELATSVHKEVVKRINRKDRGVKEASYYVLSNTNMPAALLEAAFLTNPEEARLLLNPDFRQRIAEGISAGVEAYVSGSTSVIDPGNFEEYLLLSNPSGNLSDVEISFMCEDGEVQIVPLTVRANSRMTIRADDYVPGRDVSCLVRSKNDVPILAERAMYFDFEKGKGGSCAEGSSLLGTQWYFSEGSTAWGFSTYILVQNPGEKESKVNFSFMRSDGFSAKKSYTVSPTSRFTLDVSSVSGFEKADFSVAISSTEPVVAERAMYFTGHEKYQGGHVSPGTWKPASRWYLAEGYTGCNFETYVLVANPAKEKAKIEVTYLCNGGKAASSSYELLPMSRGTIHLNSVPEISGKDVSVIVDSDKPILVERSMYFDFPKEGSNAPGSPELAKTWYLAEGSTANGFDTYILLMNPNGSQSKAELCFSLPDGKEKTINEVVEPFSRKTVKVDDVGGMGSTDFATRVTSTQPIFVERAMYFECGSKSGGHVAGGVTEPQTCWYFAEGSTR